MPSLLNKFVFTGACILFVPWLMLPSCSAAETKSSSRADAIFKAFTVASSPQRIIMSSAFESVAVTEAGTAKKKKQVA